jgi:hypothetical protein
MVDEHCPLIQDQRHRIKEKEFRSMIKYKIQNFGIQHLKDEMNYLNSTSDGINSKTYGLSNIDMAFIISNEIERFTKRKAELAA